MNAIAIKINRAIAACGDENIHLTVRAEDSVWVASIVDNDGDVVSAEREWNVMLTAKAEMIGDAISALSLLCLDDN